MFNSKNPSAVEWDDEWLTPREQRLVTPREQRLVTSEAEMANRFVCLLDRMAGQALAVCLLDRMAGQALVVCLLDRQDRR